MTIQADLAGLLDLIDQHPGYEPDRYIVSPAALADAEAAVPRRDGESDTRWLDRYLGHVYGPAQ